MLKPTSLINASTDNNHNHLPNYLHPDSLELHNKSAVLSARRKVAGHLTTLRRNRISQERDLRAKSTNTSQTTKETRTKKLKKLSKLWLLTLISKTLIP